MASQQPCLSPLAAVSLAAHHLRNPDPRTLLDFTTLLKYIDGFLRPRLDGDINAQPQRELQTLGEAFALFFFGWDCSDLVVFQWEPRLLADTGSRGLTWDAHQLGKTVVSIEPYPDGEFECDCFQWRTDSLLSTLAHEVVHAYLRTQACQGGRCGKAACSQVFRQELGVWGHGDAFLQLAALVQRQVRDRGLWDVDLLLKREAGYHCWRGNVRLSEDTVTVCWPYETVDQRAVRDHSGGRVSVLFSGTGW